MHSMFKAAVICLGTLASVSAAEAMPALSHFATMPAVSGSGAQIEKTVVIVRRRVIVRRPVRRVRPVRRIVRGIVRHL